MPGSHNRNATLLLDGAMGTELESRGINLDLMWSASALVSSADVVRNIHADYIRAGADIITTNTYAITRRQLAQANLEDHLLRLNQLACQLACEARQANNPAVLIAGSMPPQSGTYRPDKVGLFEEIEPLYREQAAILADYVDLLLCETMSSASEAYAAASAACKFGKPVWVSWTLSEDGSARLRSGETVVEAIHALAGLPVSGFLVNCTAPESVSAAIPLLAATGTKHVGGYANTYQPIPADFGDTDDDAELDFRKDLDPDQYVAHAAKWLDAGATLIGGCCGTRPAHIQKLRELLDSR
jgi:S-methylmethionine-dependent homocysteine/selenocysteine methylase